MPESIIIRICGLFRRLENTFNFMLGSHRPTDAYALAGMDYRPPKSQLSSAEGDIRKIFDTSILLAVQRSRRTIERRMKERFGRPGYHMKTLQPKTNLLVCNTCGHFHEAGVLCPHCYGKIREETEAMQKTIEENLGLEPVDKEVIVLYEGERLQQPNEFWQGKRIIEMKRERPAWFSKNLLQKSTTAPSTSSDVKPSELG